MQLSEFTKYKPLNKSQKELLPNLIVKFIQTNCSEYLNQKPKNKNLYRGLGQQQPKRPVSLGSSPNLRQSVDLGEINQRYYDTAIQQAGAVALRSNSIFCTSDQSIADNYGFIFIIFPINGFNYTWSSKVDDLASDFELNSKDRKTIDKIYDNWQNNNENFIGKDDILLCQTLGFQFDQNLSKAIQSGHEIYIHGHFVLIEENWFNSNLQSLLN